MTKLNIDDIRWAAVCARDASSDGTFVFAVLTTGIYCRPSCSSRPAKRENVRFYLTGGEAEKDGYRTCKKCRPDTQTSYPHAEAVTAACKTIEIAEEEPDLALLARNAGLSPSHFQRVFKAQVGLSPKRYAMALRNQRLRDQLPNAKSVTNAIYDVGYGSSSRAYDNQLGMTPRRYHKGAEGETIRYASAGSSLGEILVAATARGICSVEFGDRDDLVEQLQNRFPKAELEPADGTMAELVDQVVSVIDEPGVNPQLPLDIRGTAFQERVWQALRRIPLGQTVSYAELAEKIGQPTAARAVARACATNGIAVVIPCHRVVRGSGELSGYKWGVERKRKLLKREAAAGNDMELSTHE